MMSKFTRDIKSLTTNVTVRIGEQDGERGIYATKKEVKELRKLCVLLQRLFGLFASLESDG